MLHYTLLIYIFSCNGNTENKRCHVINCNVTENYSLHHYLEHRNTHVFCWQVLLLICKLWKPAGWVLADILQNRELPKV